MGMRLMKAFLALDEGLRILLGSASPVTRTESVPLLQAAGRVLAQPIRAEMDVPPFQRAAMDGYAVRAQDTFGAGNFNPARLRLAEVVHAADLAEHAVEAGTCIQIATGAPVPAGADAVVQVEDTELEAGPGDSLVRIYTPVYPRQNVSQQGKDIPAGREVLRPGTLLSPSKIGVLAALGQAQVVVFARPVVAVLPSGNEIVPPGEPLAPGHIYDINSYTLAAVIQEHGGLPRLFPVMRDAVDDVRRSLQEAVGNSDLVVLSGGSSVGERDVMVEAVEGLGEVKFHGIAVKPGKPTLCGLIQGRLVLGMPGYPTSCLTNGYGLLVPVLRQMAQFPMPRAGGIELPMARRFTSTIGRHQFLPVRIEDGLVVPAFKESGAITSMADAEGYIEIPANVDLVEKGERVLVKFF
ncbi:MAG TPA: gephyrin-like molybdotransferase Glp [Candidatus Sulfotelmatobacter sp.]|nr:gephyrin-like molybdotransferase Glp [Candidatus Sulfotelmatobacter sp.]